MLNILNKNKNKKETDHFQVLSTHLEKKKANVLEEFKKKHKETIAWSKKKGIKPTEIAQKGAKGLAAGIATSAMVFSAGAAPIGQIPTKEVESKKEISKQINDPKIKSSVMARQDVTAEVKNALKETNMNDEKKMEKTLSNILKIPVYSELKGIRLNATSGIIGYESHLSRYPGDNILTHFQSSVEAKRFSKTNMSGGPGAWGYIAPNKNTLTQKDIDREKYYLVAQTWLSPNWGTGVVKQWFRHRKMIVVNPQNGHVVVGVLEDAGPEENTGRKFGGSPEIFEELDLFNTDPFVLMFFVDDPKDQITLGRYGI